MPIGPARMPLMDHLGELRMRLVRILVCFVVAACVFYFSSKTIGNFLLDPGREYFDQDPQMLSLLDPFIVRLKLAMWAALIACMPVILWQILAFFLPALKPKERKWFIPTLGAAIVLFLFGAVFCYLIILPAALEWLASQAEGFAILAPEMGRYLDMTINFVLAFGLAFELPVVIFYLVIFNVVPYQTVRKKWREIYVGLMILSAVVTPDASPVTMLLMFAALVALYEVSLLIARIVLRGRLKRQAAQEAKEEELVLADEGE